MLCLFYSSYNYLLQGWTINLAQGPLLEGRI